MNTLKRFGRSLSRDREGGGAATLAQQEQEFGSSSDIGPATQERAPLHSLSFKGTVSSVITFVIE